jgi:hypothetical protein
MKTFEAYAMENQALKRELVQMGYRAINAEELAEANEQIVTMMQEKDKKPVETDYLYPDELNLIGILKASNEVLRRDVDDRDVKIWDLEETIRILEDALEKHGVYVFASNV